MQTETIKSINDSQIITDYGIRYMINDQNLRIGQRIYCQGDYVMGWEQPPYIINNEEQQKNYTGFFNGYDLFSITGDNSLKYENSSSASFYKENLYPADSYKNIGFNRFYEYIYSFYLKNESGSLNLYIRIFVGDIFTDFKIISGGAIKDTKISATDGSENSYVVADDSSFFTNAHSSDENNRILYFRTAFSIERHTFSSSNVLLGGDFWINKYDFNIDFKNLILSSVINQGEIHSYLMKSSNDILYLANQITIDFYNANQIKIIDSINADFSFKERIFDFYFNSQLIHSETFDTPKKIDLSIASKELIRAENEIDILYYFILFKGDLTDKELKYILLDSNLGFIKTSFLLNENKEKVGLNLFDLETQYFTEETI